MDRGKWVIMFPEGTRSERGEQGTYKTGAARLAVATGASIVPDCRGVSPLLAA